MAACPIGFARHGLFGESAERGQLAWESVQRPNGFSRGRERKVEGGQGKGGRGKQREGKGGRGRTGRGRFLECVEPDK